MLASTLASQDFVLLSATAAARDAAALLGDMRPAWVVVAPGDGGGGYRLADAAELARALAAAPDGATLGEAADAAGIRIVPAVEDGAPPPDAERWVVLEDGLLAGVVDLADPHQPITGRDTLRGAPEGHAAASVGGAEEEDARLCASFPEQVRRGEAASLLVWIGEDEEGAASAPVRLDPTRPVDVMVRPGEGFAVEGPDEATLDPGGMDTLRFRLRAVGEGPGKVRVFAFQDGRTLAVLTLRPRIGTGATATARLEADAALPPFPAGGAPDVSVLVMERREGGRPVLELLVHAHDPALGLFHRRFGPVPLSLEPLAFFNDFFREIEEEGERGALDPGRTARALEAKGAWLFETLVPAELRQVLWRLRDRIRTLQVSSDEPWIPWELCRLTGEEEGEVVEDDFLCGRFQMTRWMAGVPLRRRLSLRNVALVAPRDSGLAAVAAERAYFGGLEARGVAVTAVPATAAAVQQALAGGTYDAVHFSGHGAFRDANPDRSALLLEGGDRLSAEAISGRVRNLGKASPVVFLNACHAGRGGQSLVDVGGFARRFVGAGAAAFVGACWAVYDQPASAFATALYERLLAGEPMGAAALAARRAVRADGDPTWLAFTVYADPYAAVG
ncbi:MAG TPA: CHAT domain-containing protein [Longimicrobium sp.]